MGGNSIPRLHWPATAAHTLTPDDFGSIFVYMHGADQKKRGLNHQSERVCESLNVTVTETVSIKE